MKKVILLTLLVAFGAPAVQANLGCGIKPIPPIGCTSNNAVCMCDENGNCRWVFVGCN